MDDMICVTVVYSREIINMSCVFKGDNMFLVGNVSGLVENFQIGICSDTMNVINVKLCVMVQHSELYLFIPLSATLTILQDHSKVKQFI